MSRCRVPRVFEFGGCDFRVIRLDAGRTAQIRRRLMRDVDPNHSNSVGLLPTHAARAPRTDPGAVGW